MKKLLILIASSLVLSACLPEPNSDPVGPVSLAVAAASPDYSASDVILINPEIKLSHTQLVLFL
jgi:hypothetical protein